MRRPNIQEAAATKAIINGSLFTLATITGAYQHKYIISASILLLIIPSTKIINTLKNDNDTNLNPSIKEAHTGNIIASAIRLIVLIYAAITQAHPALAIAGGALTTAIMATLSLHIRPRNHTKPELTAQEIANAARKEIKELPRKIKKQYGLSENIIRKERITLDDQDPIIRVPIFLPETIIDASGKKNKLYKIEHQLSENIKNRINDPLNRDVYVFPLLPSNWDKNDPITESDIRNIIKEEIRKITKLEDLSSVFMRFNFQYNVKKGKWIVFIKYRPDERIGEDKIRELARELTYIDKKLNKKYPKALNTKVQIHFIKYKKIENITSHDVRFKLIEEIKSVPQLLDKTRIFDINQHIRVDKVEEKWIVHLYMKRSKNIIKHPKKGIVYCSEKLPYDININQVTKEIEQRTKCRLEWLFPQNDNIDIKVFLESIFG